MDANRKEGNMKKQYRIVERHWPYYNIILYHDGVEIATKDSNQMMIGMDTDKLEEEGYTYGYTDDEIEEARKKYEHKLENRIGPDVETYEGEWQAQCSYCFDYICTNCKEPAITYEDQNYTECYHLTKYCPNCGAKMKGAK